MLRPSYKNICTCVHYLVFLRRGGDGSLTIYIIVVTPLTAWFSNQENSNFFPHKVNLRAYFIRITERIAITSLFSVNLSLFVADTGGVLCGNQWVVKYRMIQGSLSVYRVNVNVTVLKDVASVNAANTAAATTNNNNNDDDDNDDDDDNNNNNNNIRRLFVEFLTCITQHAT